MPEMPGLKTRCMANAALHASMPISAHLTIAWPSHGHRMALVPGFGFTDQVGLGPAVLLGILSRHYEIIME